MSKLLGAKMKLTKTQERAAAKLTDRLQCAYTLGESIATMNALVAKGVAVCVVGRGSMFSPRTAYAYKLASNPNFF